VLAAVILGGDADTIRAFFDANRRWQQQGTQIDAN
jgi:hypothetical protein